MFTVLLCICHSARLNVTLKLILNQRFSKSVVFYNTLYLTQILSHIIQTRLRLNKYKLKW